jgi:hypothetical protein
VAGGVAALLPRFAIGQSADARVLRFVSPLMPAATQKRNSAGAKMAPSRKSKPH